MPQNLPPMPPGWHPDPAGQPGQRYHDGQRWTQHFVPTPPTPQTPGVAVAVSAGGGPNNALHAVLTLLSCGLWLPIWILIAIFSATSSSASAAVAVGPGGVVAKAGGRKYVGLMILGVLMVGGIVSEHPWLLAVMLVLGGIGGVLAWILKSAQQREREQRQEQFQRDMFTHRADDEDRLFQAGDDRGMYGQYPPPGSSRSPL
jgi:hypothetical protein